MNAGMKSVHLTVKSSTIFKMLSFFLWFLQLVTEQFTVGQILNSVTREDLRRVNLKYGVVHL